MNILVTLDRNYLQPLRVMLGSLYLNNPGQVFDVYLVGDGLTAEDLAGLEALCAPCGALHPVEVPAELFAGAPVVRYYSRAMYYRLLAAQFLPQTLDRVLYLDPDILVINPLRPLYDTNLEGKLMAASVHRGLTDISSRVNQPAAAGYTGGGGLFQLRRAGHGPECHAAADGTPGDLRLCPGTRRRADSAGSGHSQRSLRHGAVPGGRERMEL